MGILMYSILGATVGIKFLLWMYCSVSGMRLCSLVGPVPILVLAYMCWPSFVVLRVCVVTRHYTFAARTLLLDLDFITEFNT